MKQESPHFSWERFKKWDNIPKLMTKYYLASIEKSWGILIEG